MIVFLHGDHTGQPHGELNKLVDDFLETSGIVFGIRDYHSPNLHLIGEQAEIMHYMAKHTGGECFSVPTSGYEKTLVVPKRPLWARLIHGTLAWVGGIALALACMSSTVIVPIVLCEGRAQKVHDSIHIGMTVQEVLDTAKDCDVFQAGSEFPYDQKTDGDNIPAMGLSWRRDGTYRTYDLAARRDISFTQSEAIERLHAKLHDGYKWDFRYSYINMTPMHVSFSVVFGPDGRVAEVKPVYGWD